jgi:hypothetical protein
LFCFDKGVYNIVVDEKGKITSATFDAIVFKEYPMICGTPVALKQEFSVNFTKANYVI